MNLSLNFYLYDKRDDRVKTNDNFMFSKFLTVFIIVGLVGNLLYMIGDWKAAKAKFSLNIKDVYLHSCFLALFNTMFLMSAGFIVSSELRNNTHVEEHVCYAFLATYFGGTVGIPYTLVCMAVEIYKLTKNQTSVKERSYRFCHLIRDVLFWGVTTLVVCVRFSHLGWPWESGFCYLIDRIFIPYYYFLIGLTIIGLLANFVTYAKSNYFTYLNDSSALKYAATKNMTISALYSFSMLPIWIYQASNTLFFMDYDEQNLFWKILIFLSFTGACIFPFIYKITLPKEVTQVDQELQLVKNG